MFDGMDMGALMQQAQQMQADMQKAQEDLAAAEITGTAGGGLVTATMKGTGEVSALEIKPEAIDPSDPEGLADLVLAALRDANAAVQKLTEEKMGPLTAGLGGGMPGAPGAPGAGGGLPGLG